jgi:hypothetical protein
MTLNKNLPTVNKEINSLEDKRDYTQFHSKEEVAKALEEAKLIKNKSNQERGELCQPQTEIDLDERDTDTFNPEDCQDFRSPETEKALMDYLRSEYLKSKVLYGNALSIGASFATGSTNAIIKYAQTQDSLESLGYGFVTALICGAIGKTYTHFRYERPLKKLEQTRTKISSLEK